MRERIWEETVESFLCWRVLDATQVCALCAESKTGEGAPRHGRQPRTDARLQSLESVEMRNSALAQIMPGTAYEHAKTYSRVSTRNRQGTAN